MRILEKAKNVRDQIELVKSRSKKLDDQIHTIAVSCLWHADQHGDITLMQDLIKAMGRSQRRNAVIGWANHFGKFKPSDDGKSVVFCRENNTDIEGAIGTSPWDFSPEKAFKPFDMNAELDKLLSRAQKAMEKERFIGNADTIKALEQLKAGAGVHAVMQSMEGIPAEAFNENDEIQSMLDNGQITEEEAEQMRHAA